MFEKKVSCVAHKSWPRGLGQPGKRPRREGRNLVLPWVLSSPWFQEVRGVSSVIVGSPTDLGLNVPPSRFCFSVLAISVGVSLFLPYL